MANNITSKFFTGATNGVIVATSDIYIGEMGIRFDGTISASMPADGASLTLIVG